ncbi:MAG: hypothetical protein NWP64_09460 [Maribacter sp.]|nr:hypothetical protein [Maribacter sp.]
MKKVNLYFGIFLFLVFVATGYYMEEYFKPENLDKHVMRMQIRASHIYILFISLLNILAFKINLSVKKPVLKYVDILFRIVLIAAGILSVFAFSIEHTGDLSKRSWTLLTVVLSLIAIGLMLLNVILNQKREKKSI